MKWRDAVTDPPKVKGEYFVVHPRYGKCVFGWNDGWDVPDVPQPARWIDETSD